MRRSAAAHISRRAQCAARLRTPWRDKLWLAVWHLLLAGGLVPSAPAAAPQLEALFPVAVAVGTTNPVTLSGKFDPWPPRFWIEGEGVRLIAETNRGNARIEVEPGALCGARWLRVFNDEGTSVPRLLLITPTPDRLEVEPNDLPSKAQTLEQVPGVIQGHLQKSGDVDSHAIALAAGEWLEARLEAYTLASKIDPLMHLVTPAGVPLTWNHDDITLDPRLVWRATSNGPVVVQVMGFSYPATASVQFAGGDGCHYRLHLTKHEKPPRGAQLTADGSPPGADPPVCGELQLWQEIESILGTPGTRHRYPIQVEAGVTFRFEVEAARLGSPVDAWVALEDERGKELARNDDFGVTRDPRLDWTPPATGRYWVVVGNLVRRGGPDARYRLQARPLPPDYEVVLTSTALVVAAGTTNSLSFTVQRQRGFDHPLRARLVGVPEDIQCEPVVVRTEGGETPLVLVAPADAHAFNGPVELRVVDETTAEERAVAVRMTATTVDNGVPGGYATLERESLDSIWLTVSGRPKPPP